MTCCVTSGINPNICTAPGTGALSLDLMQKDIELALDTATELKVPLATAESAREILAVARELGYGQRDLAALFTVLEQSSPARPDSR